MPVRSDSAVLQLDGGHWMRPMKLQSPFVPGCPAAFPGVRPGVAGLLGAPCRDPPSHPPPPPPYPLLGFPAFPENDSSGGALPDTPGPGQLGRFPDPSPWLGDPSGTLHAAHHGTDTISNLLKWPFARMIPRQKFHCHYNAPCHFVEPLGRDMYSGRCRQFNSTPLWGIEAN